MRSTLVLLACVGAAMGSALRASREARIASELEPRWPQGAAYLRSILSARSDEAWAARSEGDGFKDGDPKWCPQPSAFRLLPEVIAQVSAPSAGGSAQFSTPQCWSSVTATLRLGGSGDAWAFAVDLVGSKPDELLCGDLLVVTTSYQSAIVELEDLSPNATATFSAWISAGEQAEVAAQGLHVLLMPCGLLGTVDSALATVNLFVSEGEAEIEANAAFLTDYNIMPSPLPSFNNSWYVHESFIRSGDYFAIGKFDGLDPLIMLGTLGRTGHSAVALWGYSSSGARTLYVLESTDADPFGPAYWPPPYGIRLTEYNEWVALAQNASYHVHLLPLRSDLAARFNETAAWSFFNGVQGMPYGYHNMLYSWADTSPMQNMPAPLGDVGTVWLLSTLDLLLPESSEGVSIYAMITMGLNKRLNLNCTHLACALDYLQTRNMTLTEAIAMPEQDAWFYGPNVSLVCSCFAARVWLAGLQGVLPPFQGTEQSPKDNYQLAIYDPTRFNATVCPPPFLRTATTGNYCQIMGPYSYELDNYNSIPIFAHVNEECASQWPYFGDRCPDGGWNCSC
jgi:hypothetical protein